MDVDNNKTEGYINKERWIVLFYRQKSSQAVIPMVCGFVCDFLHSI